MSSMYNVFLKSVFKTFPLPMQSSKFNSGQFNEKELNQIH